MVCFYECVTAPSSSFGLGRYPVTVKTWVQIPLGPPFQIKLHF